MTPRSHDRKTPYTPDIQKIEQDPLGHLLGVMDLEYNGDVSGEDVYSGESVHQPSGRVYGGQVLAQALLAAGRTVDPQRPPHSLHGYFLRAGDIHQPVDFTVERLRDGGSFSARRAQAYQGGNAILSMIASFQEVQDGLEVSAPMPQVAGPESLRPAHEELADIEHPAAAFWTRQSAFDIRHVEPSIYLSSDSQHPTQQSVWMKARGPVAGDQLLHRALLAYACDQIMLEPVIRGVGHSWISPGLSIASLDHAMWWHRDVAVDEWFLFVQDAPSAQGGRGLGTARVYQQDGTLVATTTQEGMTRFGAPHAANR
ncbi:acyl-CoA thioesterase [Jonesia quinghaiensis]|uniref:acyl-CoA thioesterase n=1 Tax=Jonesia quinghaiensis TaxID=262806 RepID=UPI0004110A8A|nr:acyl-CoA thioesterase II [Jonesia quinghaiensis]